MNLIINGRILLSYSSFPSSSLCFTCTGHVGPKQQDTGEVIQTEASSEAWFVSWCGPLALLRGGWWCDLWPPLNPWHSLYRSHHYEHWIKQKHIISTLSLCDDKYNFWSLPFKLCLFLWLLFFECWCFGILKFIRKPMLSITDFGITPGLIQ